MSTDVSNLTYMDRALIAHDFLNPNIPDNYYAGAIAMIESDRREAEQFAVRDAYVNSAATCAAEMHAYLAFGVDIRG